MVGTLTVSARSVEAWTEAKPHVLAIFMYVTGEAKTTVQETAVGCQVKMAWGPAQKGFRMLIEQLKSKEFPVKVRLGVELNGTRQP